MVYTRRLEGGRAWTEARTEAQQEMKTEIIKIKGDWQDVVNDCRATVGKGALGKEPSEAFKRSILLAEHSPIRNISVKWRWSGIKSWIATHWSRHKWECYIRTQRDDRTGVERDDLPQGAPVDFVGEANAQNLIDTWRKRLCHQAHPETRAYAEDFKAALHEIEPEIADALVPNCIYRGDCPEIKCCRFYDQFLSYWIASSKRGMVGNLRDRYKVYNEYFADKRSE